MASSPVPSPIPDATSSVRGLISTLTQSWAGLKTFMTPPKAVFGGLTRSLLLPRLYVRDFGAVGDGTTDDGPAIQSALDAAQAHGLWLLFDPLTYKTNQELNAGFCKLVGTFGTGSGVGVTTLVAGAAIRSVLRVVDQAQIENMEIDGVFLADYAGLYASVGNCQTRHVNFQRGIFDAVHLDTDAGENDKNTFHDVQAQLSGRIFHSSGRAIPDVGCPKVLVSGTISVVLNGTALVGTSTAFTTELAGWRVGDFISVGPGSVITDNQWFQILNVVDDTHITCFSLNPAAIARTNQAYEVCIGAGFYEDVGNNSLQIYEHCLARNNAGTGLSHRGLYGSTILDLQADFNGAFPLEIGLQGLAAPQNTKVLGLYTEGENVPGVVWVGNTNGLIVQGVDAGQLAIKLVNDALSSGWISGDLNDGGNTIRPIGSQQCFVPSMAIDPGALLKGILYGQNYTQNGAGGSSLTMRDFLAASWAAVSGTGAGGIDGSSVGYQFDTANDLTAGKLFRWLNQGVELVVADYLGNLAATEFVGSIADGVFRAMSKVTNGAVTRAYIFDTLNTITHAAGTDYVSWRVNGSEVIKFLDDGGATFNGNLLAAGGVDLHDGGIFNFSDGDANNYLTRASANNLRHGDGTTPTFITGEVYVKELGVRQSDTTGTPGPGTATTGSGRASIASGDSSVVITCALCTTGGEVIITQIDRDATCKELVAVVASGHFTVSGSAAASADLKFMWLYVGE